MQYSIVVCVNLNSLIEARHVHGIETGDKAACVREVGSLFAYLLHTNDLSLSSTLMNT